MAAIINQDASMENTIDMLSMLSENELAAVNAVIRAFVSNQNDNNPFSAKTEQQLFEKIDRALANADMGLYKDSEEFEKELLEEFGA